MFITHFLFLSLIAVTIGHTHPQDEVKVSIYYETRCRYSVEFFEEQLTPAFLELKGTGLILDPVPFGNANKTLVDKKWTFECQHGPKECFGNKIQACILGNDNFLYDTKMQLIGCIMESGNPSSLQHAKKCAEKSETEWVTVESCVEGEEGNRLLAHYGDRTQSLVPKMTYVPYVLFNGIYNETLEDEAREDLVKVVCSLLTQKPTACNSS